ncbi:MAG: CARDB domain-containing protein [bacterium]|nr:CARDB domain-containing protein [bacterium]
MGRPDASMEYYLVGNNAPTGSMADEDCLGFSLDTVEVQRIDERWKIVDGSHWIMDFEDNEYEARIAFGVIKKYSFDRICFVGRPDPSMTYFKNSVVTRPTGAPDLTVEIISSPATAQQGENISDTITVVARNIGTADMGTYTFVDLVLSSDTTIPTGYAIGSPNYSEDVLLLGGRSAFGPLAAGQAATVTLSTDPNVNDRLFGTIPGDTPPGTYYLGVRVDPGDRIPESNETNNTDVARIEIIVAEPIGVPIKPVTTYNHAPGSEFVVNIQVGEMANPVTDLFGVSCKLHYNTSLLDVVDVVAGPMLAPAPIFVSNTDEAAGVVSIGVSRTRGNPGVSGYGSIARVTFRLSERAVGSTTARFSISDESAVNSVFNPILLTPETAGIHVVERLSTPVLISPYNDALANQVDLNYQWGAVTGAAYYWFELDNNPGFSSPEYVATTTATVYNPSSLYGPSASSLPDDTYYWRVKAC